MTDADELPWFPCYQQKWLNALAGMKPNVGYVYVVVCFRIYDCGGACPDSLDAISCRTKYNKRQVSEALDVLFRTGKLVRTAEGITNPFADKVISRQTSVRKERKEAGRQGAAVRWEKGKRKQSSDDGKAKPEPMAKNAHLQRELDLEEIPGRTDVLPAEEPDARTVLFRRGLAIFIKITGRTESTCRRLLGKFLRSANDDAIAVMRAIEDAERERVVDPVPWITRAIGVRGALPDRPSRNGFVANALRRMNQQEETDGPDASREDDRRTLPART